MPMSTEIITPQSPLSAADNVTQLLRQWRAGDEAALAQLLPLVYDELRRRARQHLRREEAGHTIQTGTLVNEACLRLLDARRVDWQDRAHFFAVAAKLMRQILVDEARRRDREKRGGGAWTRVTLDEAIAGGGARTIELLALDEALEWLARCDPHKARLVELHFYGGMTFEEIAVVLGGNANTLKSQWGRARLWLLHRLRGEEAEHESDAL